MQPKGDRVQAIVGIIAALWALVAIPANAQAQDKPRDPRAAAALRLLELEGGEATSLAFYVIEATRDEAALPALLTAPLRDALGDFELATMLQRWPVRAELALPYLIESFDRRRDEEFVCDAFSAYCDIATANDVELMSKRRRTADAGEARALTCIGAWSLAEFETLALRTPPQARDLCVAAPLREAAATRAMSWLTEPQATLPSKRLALRWLADLGVATPKIVEAVAVAIDDPTLRLDAEIALGVVLRAAPASMTLPEARLAALWRSSRSSALAAPLALRSPKFANELATTLAREGSCAAEQTLAALRPLPPPIEQWLVGELRSPDLERRDCALVIASEAVAHTPSLMDAILPRVLALAPADQDERVIGRLIDAGAAPKLTNVIAAYFRSDARRIDQTIIRNALFRHPLPPAERARLRQVLLAPDPSTPNEPVDIDALLALGPLTRAEALEVIERSFTLRGDSDYLRAWAFVATGGDEAAYLGAHLRGNAIPQLPAPLAPVRRQLELALGLLGAKPGLRVAAAALRLLKHHVDNADWKPADIPFLRGLLDAPELDTPAAGPLRLAIGAELAALTPKPSRFWRNAKLLFGAFGAHFVIWLVLLITVYPRSRTWQSLMLFNKEARAVTGLWYTQALVRVFPALRRRMFQPLLEGQGGQAPSPDAGFFDKISLCPVIPAKSPQAPHTLGAAAPWIKLLDEPGMLVIEGESGAGKSQVLRALAAKARAQGRTCLLLRASDCASGVIKAIESALELSHADGFVATLLHGGAIELFVDGLNEATPATIKEIDAFCHRARHARVIITSQPMRWAYPVGARTWRLMPLAAEQIREFLLSQWEVVAREGLDEATYAARVDAFFSARPFDERDVRERDVLRNRFDLAFVAHLLARGQEPNLHALRKQVVDDIARDYADAVPGGVFPIDHLGIQALVALELGDPVVHTEHIGQVAVELLVERKLLLRRGDGTITFRHDSITCYFAAEGAFARQVTAEGIGASVLDAAHVASARFRGVYLQLAESLPLPAAERLALALRDYQRANNGPTELDREFQAIVDRRQRAAT